MKKIFAIALIFFAGKSSAQTMKEDTLITISGFTIHPGDEILLGTGTMPNGDFKYLAESRSNIFSTTSNGATLQVKKVESGHKFKVKKIRTDGKEKNGFTYAVILFGSDGIHKYEMDADAAINTGEIVVPAEYRPKSAVVASSLSASEQLEKLGKLYKDSLITKDEFDAQKKKILSQ